MPQIKNKALAVVALNQSGLSTRTRDRILQALTEPKRAKAKRPKRKHRPEKH